VPSTSLTTKKEGVEQNSSCPETRPLHSQAEGCCRTIVIATDGYVSVEKEAFELIRKHLGKANMFTSASARA